MVTNSQCKYKTRFTTLYSVCARFILFDCSTLMLIFAGSLLWLLLMLYSIHWYQWRTHTSIHPSIHTYIRSTVYIAHRLTTTATTREKKIKSSRVRERGWHDPNSVDCHCLSFIRNTLFWFLRFPSFSQCPCASLDSHST